MLQDPDMALLVLFRPGTMPNPSKSAQAGRPIVDDLEVCEIRIPGSRSFVGVFPAHQFCRWITDPYSGTQQPQTYAERFARQYQQFQMKQEQTRTGTPLEYIPFLTEARRAELRGLNIYTVEALAHIDGQELKNLGPGGRDIKNQAEAYIEQSQTRAGDATMVANMEAMKAKLQVMEDDNKAMAERMAAMKAAQPKGPDTPNFSDMNPQQLRDYITARTGHIPHGSLNPTVLRRMAAEATPKQEPETVG